MSVLGEHDATILVQDWQARVTRGQTLLLTQMYEFRQLTPGWQFTSEQKDAAEYLRDFFQHIEALQVVWDSRCLQDGMVQLHSQGHRPTALAMPSSPARRTSLDELIWHWHQHEHLTAFVHPYSLICLQINRYVAGFKDTTIVDIPDSVMLPFFGEGSKVEWKPYWINTTVQSFI